MTRCLRASKGRPGAWNPVHPLAAVLGHAHPTLCRALGEERFTTLACRFAAEAPPRLPMLWSYGAGFADWLDGLDAADGNHPWAPDLARLAAIPPEQAGFLRLVPHPSLRLVRSAWNIHALWKDGGAVPVPEPEAVLVGRSPVDGDDGALGGAPGGEVRCARLTAADGALACRLLAGATLDEAAGDEASAGADLQSLLALLLQNRLLAGFALDRPPSFI